MSKYQDLMRKKRKEMEEKRSSSTPVLRPVQGKHKYRVLPSWRGGEELQFWHDFALHYIKAGANKKIQSVYVCLDKTFGEECPVCAAISNGIRSTSDDPTAELLKQAYASQKYLLNVLHLTGDKPTEPQLMEVGVKIFDQLCEIVEEYDNITDLVGGIDIIINREGSGLETSYTTVPAAKSAEVDASIREKLVDIDAFVNQRNPTKQAQALASIAKILGVEVASAPALTSSSSSPTAAAAMVAEDASYTEIDSDEDLSAATAVDDLDAELDLLSDEDLEVA